MNLATITRRMAVVALAALLGLVAAAEASPFVIKDIVNDIGFTPKNQSVFEWEHDLTIYGTITSATITVTIRDDYGPYSYQEERDLSIRELGHSNTEKAKLHVDDFAWGHELVNKEWVRVWPNPVIEVYSFDPAYTHDSHLTVRFDKYINYAIARVDYGDFYVDQSVITMVVNGDAGLATGSGTVHHSPTGFQDGGYDKNGMPSGHVPLAATVEVDDLELDAGMATLVVDYDPAEMAAKGIDEQTLCLYVYDEDSGLWGLAGRHTNNDPSQGAWVLGEPTGQVGDWGVNVDADFAWANIDHASIYAVAGLPEPGTIALLALGGLALLRPKRR